jgi:two-component system nitrogen regulation response regulator GlnG
MSDNAMQFLSGLDLPGNVRQLENLCNWITVMAPGQTVEIKDLPQELINEKGVIAPVFSSAPVANAPLSSFQSSASTSADALNGSAALPVFTNSAPASVSVANGSHKESWISLLESEAAQMLSAGQPEVMDALGRQFESALIKTALKHTHGRKNDAAVRLGIGRNTITRKIQELGISGAKDD